MTETGTVELTVGEIVGAARELLTGLVGFAKTADANGLPTGVEAELKGQAYELFGWGSELAEAAVVEAFRQVVKVTGENLHMLSWVGVGRAATQTLDYYR